MNPTSDIKLSWCNKHKEWWVMNCPDCMADVVEEDTFLKARNWIMVINEFIDNTDKGNALFRSMILALIPEEA